MIRFSFSSFYMSLFFANMMILILYLIFRNQKLMIKLGLPMLGAVLCVTILRMLLPFEFLFLSRNIYFPEIISKLIGWFVSPRFIQGRFSYWSIVEGIWLSGILISGIRWAVSEHSFSKNIRYNGRTLSDSSAACQILRKIQEDNPKTRYIKILTVPDLLSPSIYGIRRPRILLPEGLILNEETLYYAISHEISHYLHHDLYLKLGLELLGIIYWWNPLFKFLDSKIDTVMEMRVDQSVAVHLDQKTEYLNCLISVANFIADTKSASSPANTITLCKPPNSAFKNRYNMLLPHEIRPLGKWKVFILQLTLIILFILSYLFIFEGSYITPNDSFNAIIPNMENCYLVEKDDGRYDIYLDDELFETIDFNNFYSNDIPIR